MGHLNAFILLFVGLLSFHQALANPTDRALISPNELKNSLKTSSDPIVILDLRSPEKYQQGHLPGAINIPLAQLHRKKGDVDGFVETPQSFRLLMEKNGVQNRDNLVLYSDWSFLDAARVYWILDFYGHQQKRILDGGYQAWEEKDYPISLDSHSKPKSTYMVSVKPEKLATKLQTLVASKNDDYLIIDARPTQQYAGKASLTDRKGRIPESINIPWYDLLKKRTEADGYEHMSHATTYENIETLKKTLGQLPKDKKLIVYCNGGQESSIVYVALKELQREAALYDGSWFEWSDDKALPVVR